MEVSMKRIVIISLILLLKLNVYAYDNEKVHQLINENASLRSSNFITTMKVLGFTGNSPSEIIELNVVNGKKIKDWFRDGAKEEDIPLVRSYYHFHDPTKAWDKAGLDDYVLGILHVTGDSSVLWTQNPDQKYIASDGTVYDVNGTWSWPKARDYYYQALISTDKTLREQNLAFAFRALGQTMHLLADSAVPEHVRNEEHAFGWHYEKWCEQNSTTLNATATVIDYSITNNSLISGLVPITNFWDTMPLPGYNLNPIGLSEYTNFNFLGRDTIFKNYTYPQKPNTLYLEPVIAEDGTTDYRVYFSGETSDSQNINHLASTGYLWSELSTVYPDNIDDSRFNLDDKSFEDYASILVNKAVGYSAGLLNYFFRGGIETCPQKITDSAGNIAGAKLKVRNLTSNEILGPGKLIISYQYKPSGSSEFIYGLSNEVSLNESISSDLESILEYTFNFNTTVPKDAQAVRFVLVFRGTLGHETDSVIGSELQLGQTHSAKLVKIVLVLRDYEEQIDSIPPCGSWFYTNSTGFLKTKRFNSFTIKPYYEFNKQSCMDANTLNAALLSKGFYYSDGFIVGESNKSSMYTTMVIPNFGSLDINSVQVVPESIWNDVYFVRANALATVVSFGYNPISCGACGAGSRHTWAAGSGLEFHLHTNTGVLSKFSGYHDSGCTACYEGGCESYGIFVSIFNGLVCPNIDTSINYSLWRTYYGAPEPQIEVVLEVGQ